ncbi:MULTISPECIES: HipA domain-containing protein [unclassified Dysgonomonas]|uniref:HipA domain-containing protein n=1 Tax=unclassified Dysgonomonas TaxID=2630389 RepID=UPI002474EF4D|nr:MULTISPECIES: HipA domain-containing protein [unclassified Dysgonomonas]
MVVFVYIWLIIFFIASQIHPIVHKKLHTLFRQMIFDAMNKNRDDHAKNFSFQLINGE